MTLEGATVWVVDAWDDEAQESYVRVFATPEKARRDLERWSRGRKEDAVYAGVVKRKVL
jgi:hypothetical protein